MVEAQENMNTKGKRTPKVTEIYKKKHPLSSITIVSFIGRKSGFEKREFSQQSFTQLLVDRLASFRFPVFQNCRLRNRLNLTLTRGKWQFLLSKDGLKRVELISSMLCLPWRRGTCSMKGLFVVTWKLLLQVLTCGFSRDKVERADDVLYVIKRRLLQVIQLHASSDFTINGRRELICVLSYHGRSDRSEVFIREMLAELLSFHIPFRTKF